MYEIEVEAAMRKIVNGTVARTSFQDNQSYVTCLFSEWYYALFSVKLHYQSKWFRYESQTNQRRESGCQVLPALLTSQSHPLSMRD